MQAAHRSECNVAEVFWLTGSVTRGLHPSFTVSERERWIDSEKTGMRKRATSIKSRRTAT